MMRAMTKNKFEGRVYGVFFSGVLSTATARCPKYTSCNSLGSWLFFSNNLKENIALTEEETKFQFIYQNYYSNFIRTGDPNDFTDNPNGAVMRAEMKTWAESDDWFQMDIEQQKMLDWNDPVLNTPVNRRCNFLDEMNEYMVH